MGGRGDSHLVTSGGPYLEKGGGGRGFWGVGRVGMGGVKKTRGDRDLCDGGKAEEGASWSSQSGITRGRGRGERGGERRHGWGR